MRDVRDKISKEIADLTPEQIKEYFSKKKLNERIMLRAYHTLLLPFVTAPQLFYLGSLF